jgi:hypothetical protein
MVLPQIYDIRNSTYVKFGVAKYNTVTEPYGN